MKHLALIDPDELAGKVVDRIDMSFPMSLGVQSVTINFTDGTFITIDVCTHKIAGGSPKPALAPRYGSKS